MPKNQRSSLLQRTKKSFITLAEESVSVQWRHQRRPEFPTHRRRPSLGRWCSRCSGTRSATCWPPSGFVNDYNALAYS